MKFKLFARALLALGLLALSVHTATSVHGNLARPALVADDPKVPTPGG